MLLIIIELLNPIIYTSLIIPSLSEKISSIHEIRIKNPPRNPHTKSRSAQISKAETPRTHIAALLMILSMLIFGVFWASTDGAIYKSHNHFSLTINYLG